ncbi:hypothetical protein BC827DRAFT_1082371, partial [Russula dissimulans]
QFPIQLTFTLTINKAQGQSVKNVGINLSRATSYDRLKVLLNDDSPNNYTSDVVYKEILL